MTDPAHAEMNAEKVVEMFLPHVTDIRDELDQARQAEANAYGELDAARTALEVAQRRVWQSKTALEVTKGVVRASLEAIDPEPAEGFLAQTLIETGTTRAAQASLDRLQQLNEYLANDGSRTLVVLGGISVQGAEAESNEGTAQVAFVHLHSRYHRVWLDRLAGVPRVGMSAREVRQFPLREGALSAGWRERPEGQSVVPGAFGDVQFAHTSAEAEELLESGVIPRFGRGGFLGGGPIPTAVISGEGVGTFTEVLGDKNHFLRAAIAAAMGNPNAAEALPAGSDDLYTDRANFHRYFKDYLEAILYHDPASDGKAAAASMLFSSEAQAFLKIPDSRLADHIVSETDGLTEVVGRKNLVVTLNIVKGSGPEVETLEADEALKYLVHRLGAAGLDLSGVVDSKIYDQTLRRIRRHALERYQDDLGKGWLRRGWRKEVAQRIEAL